MIPENPAANFPWYVRALMAGKKDGTAGAAIDFAETRRAPDRVTRVLKNQPALVAGDFADQVSADYQIMVSQFVDSLRTRSAFFRMLEPGGFVRVPMNTRVGIVTAGGDISPVKAAGAAIPVHSISLSNQTLSPVRASAIFVASSELIQNVSGAGQALMSSQLRGVISDSVDAEFFGSVIDTDTPVLSSSGSDAASIVADLRELLGSVNSINPSLFFVASPDVARIASTAYGTGGFLCPALSVMGGELLNLPCMVSSVLSAGTLYLIDASGIAADFSSIEVRASASADVEMLLDPTQNSAVPTASASVSMFQTDCIATRIVAYMGIDKLRDDSVAMLAGIEWGTV